MRSRYCRVCEGWHDLDEPWPLACISHNVSRETSGIQIIKDIEPYRSVVTREMIGGRKQHRDHLRAHGCIEVGNEKPKAFRPDYVGGIGRDIKRAMEAPRGG